MDYNPQFGSFVGDVIVRWINDRQMNQLCVLMEDFTYVTPTGERYTARQGMIFDGASIPQFFWSMLKGPLEGPHRRAAIIHDQLCQDGEAGKGIVDSSKANDIFRNAILCGFGERWRARCMWLGVRIGGPKFKATQ